MTHDQEEALVLSDLIAVMQNGIIQQLEAPRDIYMNPRNAYVAGFVGQTNFITGTIEKNQPKGKLVVACSFGSVECTTPQLHAAEAGLPDEGPQRLGKGMPVANLHVPVGSEKHHSSVGNLFADKLPKHE